MKFIPLINVKMPTILTQLTMEFILLINVKMPTIVLVGLLTFKSRINTASESFKARKNLYFSAYIRIYVLIKISYTVELSMKTVL